jgi:hypothetical protein
MAQENPYEKRPWLKFYDKHVSPKLKYPDMTYAEDAIKKLGGRIIEADPPDKVPPGQII